MSKRLAPSFAKLVPFCLVSIMLQTAASRAASCPVTLQSVVLQAKALSGRSYMYRATASAGAAVTIVELVVKTTHGSSTVAIDEIDRPDKKAPSKAFLWFQLPEKTMLSSVSVGSVSVAGSNVMCDASSEPVTLTPFDSPVTVYDDSTPHSDLEESRATGASEATDSDFRDRKEPGYPYWAERQDVVGDVTVEIEVGPNGGHPVDAWVRWNLTSDGSDVLANAALKAANESTFKPPTIDGRPTTRRYLIIYTFRLDDDGLADGRASDPDYRDLCPLVVDDAYFEGPSGGDPNAWYFIRASAKADDVASAVIGIEDQSGKTGYSWAGPYLQPALTEPDVWTAGAMFNWPDQSIKDVWIDHVTLTDGKTVNCLPVVERPSPVAVSGGLPRVMTGKPLPLVAIQSVFRPDFSRQVWPDFPAGVNGKRVAGHVTVLCAVNDLGIAIDAFVTDSSGDNQLDNAAIDAATESTFAPADMENIKIYEVSYRFVP